jgi:hypothetical protein
VEEGRELSEVEIALKKEKWKSLQTVRKEIQDLIGDKSVRYINTRERTYFMQLI